MGRVRETAHVNAVGNLLDPENLNEGEVSNPMGGTASPPVKNDRTSRRETPICEYIVICVKGIIVV